MQLPLLELDLLRTFVAVQDLGGLKHAANFVGRTQSAVSLQMRRLEELTGMPLFAREGRSLRLTAAGEVLLEYARRLLTLNDEAYRNLSGRQLRGRVRLGMLQDFAETLLPPVLARFSQMRPSVEMEVQVDRSTTLLERLLRKELDLVLLFERERGSGIGLGRVPMRWIVPRRRIDQEPMPLVLFEAPCVFRETALRRLKECRKPWRQSFASPSLAGLWAAVEAGLGISLRTPIGLPNTLEMVDRLPGTRALPMVEVVLHRSTEAASAAVGELAETIEAELTPRLG